MAKGLTPFTFAAPVNWAGALWLAVTAGSVTVPGAWVVVVRTLVGTVRWIVDWTVTTDSFGTSTTSVVTGTIVSIVVASIMVFTEVGASRVLVTSCSSVTSTVDFRIVGMTTVEPACTVVYSVSIVFMVSWTTLVAYSVARRVDVWTTVVGCLTTTREVLVCTTVTSWPETW